MEFIKIQIGTSLFYYIYILLCAGLFLGLYFFLRKKSKKVQYWVLFAFLAFNFVLHFVKLAFPVYVEKGFPEVIRKCTFENICAVSTLIFPFIFISKSNGFKDYMFYLGLVSGIAGCVAPLPVIGLEFYQLETIRYYLCHAGIWIVPLLSVMLGLHKLNYRRIWKTFAVYFFVLGLIIVNEIILIRIGWVETATLEEFLSPEGRDLGYAMGPPAAMEGIAKYILWLTPECFKDPYVPILWEFFPVIILGGAFCFLVSMIWDHARFKSDCIALKNRAVLLWSALKGRKRAKDDKNEKATPDDNEQCVKEDKPVE